MKRWLQVAVCCSWVVIVPASCSRLDTSLPDGSFPPLRIDRVEPTTLLPGSWVRVHGAGFEEPSRGNLLLMLEPLGPLRFERISAELVRFQVDPSLFEQLGGEGSFRGTLRVEVDYLQNGISLAQEVAIEFTLVETLEPRLDGFSAAEGAVYLGSMVSATGSSFLLEGEGNTEIRFDGLFSPQGQERVVWSGTVSWSATDRTHLAGALPGEALGIRPGRFEGDLVPVNVHQDGQEVSGSPLTGVGIELGPTALLRLETSEAGRGQWIQFSGRGFASGRARTLLRIHGSFTGRDGSVTVYDQDNPLMLDPEVLSGESLRYVLRLAADADGLMRGLGAVPGSLRGEATPVLYLGADVQVGLSCPDEIHIAILPQKQVVFVKFLPGFTAGLRRFGLRNLVLPIRNRILEVVRRDYAGISIEFVTSRPRDFAEYSVIEVGGSDPNGLDLLGLDASMSKDVGNRFFDDVVGGMSFTEGGHPAYGGVFVASFLTFSPSLSNPSPIASPLFDEVFGPFIRELGGKEAEADEMPGGARAAAIERAYLALANMIGNTISHEVGHTLGLAADSEHDMHNIVPGPNQLMDAGIERGFEERAELNGKGPARFTTEDWVYLKQILPR